MTQTAAQADTQVENPNEGVFGINNAVVRNIFQAYDPRYYRTNDVLSVDVQGEFIQKIVDTLRHLGFSYADDFAEHEPTIQSMCLTCGANDSFLCHFRYQFEENAAEPPRTREIYFLGELRHDKKGKKPSTAAPFAIITGEIETPPSAEDEVFFPFQTGARFFVEKDPRFAAAEDDFDAIQTLCYAREGLEQILSGEALSVPDMQKWLVLERTASTHAERCTIEDRMQAVEMHYMEIASMPPAQFAEALSLRQHLKSRSGCVIAASPQLAQ